MKIRWAGHAYKKLVRKPEGKRPHGRPRHRWEDDIRTDHQEIGWEGVGWIHLTKNKVQWQAPVNTVINLQLLQKAENFLTS